MHNLLGCYSATGQGVISDRDKAVAWYMKAAEQATLMPSSTWGVAGHRGLVRRRDFIVRLSPGSGRRQHKATLEAQYNLGVPSATGQGNCR